MRAKFIYICVIAMFIMLIASNVFAVTGTVDFKANTNKIKTGETFTVTVSATSEEGINGINSKFSYDTEKLELIGTEIPNPSNWCNLGIDQDITFICNSKEHIKNADIYVLKFKVKENAKVGDILKVQTEDILLDTDVAKDSKITIPAKKVEVEVTGASTKGETTPKKLEPTNDGTLANGNIPQTGENAIIIIALAILGIVLAVIFRKKYLKYKM